MTTADGSPPRMAGRWVDVAAEFIKPNDRLTSFRAHRLYNRQYWFRLIDVFLRGLRRPGRESSGETRSQSTVPAIPDSVSHPSPLAAFSWPKTRRFHLERATTKRSRQTAMALDMVRFEWAQIQASTARANRRWTPMTAWQRAPSQMRLRMQP